MWQIVALIAVAGLVLSLIVHSIFSTISGLYFGNIYKESVDKLISENYEEIKNDIVNAVTERVIPLYWNAIYSNLNKHENDVFNKVADIIVEKINSEPVDDIR
jgi:uncharacterized membrane protein YheB (UPF0754 family)